MRNAETRMPFHHGYLNSCRKNCVCLLTHTPLAPAAPSVVPATRSGLPFVTDRELTVAEPGRLLTTEMLPGILQAIEDLLVQQFVAEAAVE